MTSFDELGSVLASVDETSPLVNAITNKVTVNEVANVILNWGALPVMSDDEREIDEMISISSAGLINMGTVSESGEALMMAAGRATETHDVPLVVDPVGAGATSTRSRVAERLTTDLPVDVVKGNYGEIASLAGADAEVRGVESVGEHADVAETAMAVAREIDAVVVASGVTDIVASEDEVYEIEAGHEMMGQVVGTGCMLGGTIAAFHGAVDDSLEAAIAGTLGLALAGEAAAAGEYGDYEGPSSYEIAFLDATAGLTPEEVSAAADRIERVLTAEA
ncbi:MAG: hydroxyethylthiazole kinase [Halanaeroarchaeum sp.]